MSSSRSVAGDTNDCSPRVNLRTLAIINASSGRGSSDPRDRLSEVLRARGLDWRICLAHDGAELARLAREAAQGDAELVVAGGGDGTLSTVGSHLAGSGKVLGVLPLGTLNHFAKDLNIPLAIEAAVENLVAGHVSSVDVAEVNGRMFLNNSSIGLYPRMVVRREAQRRYGRSKWLAMISALYQTLRRYAVLLVRVTVDGKRFRRRTPILFVGNNQYEIEGRELGGRRALDRGILSLYVLHNTGVWGILKFTLRALLRRAWRIKDFDAVQAREVRVETRRKRLRVALDGEVIYIETPLFYRIRAGALRVIVPRPQPSD